MPDHCIPLSEQKAAQDSRVNLGSVYVGPVMVRLEDVSYQQPISISDSETAETVAEGEGAEIEEEERLAEVVVRGALLNTLVTLER